MLRAWLAALAMMACATLAGCVLNDGDGRSGGLVRIVELDPFSGGFDEDVNDATDVFAAIADTRFEYTHDDDPVDPAAVTVSYVDESGRDRSVPLSDFTSADSVARGDRITIPGALLTSPVRIERGEDLLASRGGASHDWLEVAGYPLPFAMRGGLAVWDLDGAIGLDAGFDRIHVIEGGPGERYVCTPPDDAEAQCEYKQTPYQSSTVFEDASAVGDADLDGELRLDSVGTALNPEVELGIEGTLVLSALFGMHLTEELSDGQTTDTDVGFEFDASAVGDGSVRLRFDRDDQLEAIGGQGDLDVTGDLIVWDEDHPRAEGYSPFSLDEIDTSTPYQEQTMYGEGNPSDLITGALRDLWRMDLAPGDEFRLDTRPEDGEGIPWVTVTLRVVSEEEKRVPAGTFDTLRIETTAVLEVPIEGAASERFELPRFTTWVDEDSGIPVAVEQTMAYDYDEADLAPLFASAESWGDTAITGPDDLHFDLEGRTVAELTEYRDGFTMAPLASILLPLATFGAPFGAFVFGFGFPLGGDHEYEAAPDAAFSSDETRDRITVIHVQPGMMNGDMQIKSSTPVRFAHNQAATVSSPDTLGMDYRPFGPVDEAFDAGDYVEFCSTPALTEPVVFTIAHWPTNTIVYESTLMSIAAC